MAFGKPRTRISPIAIDFGADSLKLLQIVPGDTPELVALGSEPLPESARSDLHGRFEFLSDALPSLLRRHPFKNRRVMLSTPASQTLVHNLLINRCDPSEIDNQVDLALRERLNVEPNRMVIRNYPGCDVVRDSRPMQEVITFAVGRDIVMRTVDLMSRLKLEVDGMHCEAACVLKAFGHLWTAKSGGDAPRPVAYVDLGAATSKIIVAEGQKMLLAKTVHAGGDQWTRRVAAQRKVEFAEARMIRMAGGEGGAATALAEPDLDLGFAEAPSSIGSELRCDTLECLEDELRMTFRHHDARHPNRPIEKLVFIGGEATGRKTCQSLARAVNVPAQLGDPLARLSRINAGNGWVGVDLAQPQPAWAVALGLCLSDANL